MPCAIIYLGTKVSDDVKGQIAKEAMNILSTGIGKPIIYCSAQVIESIGGFAGNVEPSVFIEVKSVGGLQGKQKELSDKFCSLIESKTSIKGDKVYLNFTELTGGNWGFNHKTF